MDSVHMTLLFAATEDEAFGVLGGTMQTADTTKFRPTYSRASFASVGGGLGAAFDIQLQFSGALSAYLTAQAAGDKDFWFKYHWVGGGGFVGGVVGLRVSDSSGKEFMRLRTYAAGGDCTLTTSTDGYASNEVIYAASSITQPTTPTEYAFRIKRHATLGVFQWYINGSLWFQTPVGDTTGIITGQPDKIRWTNANSNGSNYLSEVACTSADDPAVGLAVATLVPTADGFSVGWTGGVASINEVPMDTSTLLTTASALIDSTFVASNLPTLTGAQIVRGIVLSGKWRAAVGAPQHVYGLLRIGGTTYASAASQTAPSVTGTLQFIWETSPATAIGFTESETNAAEIGMRSDT
jgi:hypothetical protein